MAWTKKSLSLAISPIILTWIICVYEQPVLFTKIILTSSFIELYIVTISVLISMNETYLFLEIKFINRFFIFISFITFSIIMQNIEPVFIGFCLCTFCLVNEIFILE